LVCEEPLYIKKKKKKVKGMERGRKEIKKEKGEISTRVVWQLSKESRSFCCVVAEGGERMDLRRCRG
jgi:hypothetical protein